MLGARCLRGGSARAFALARIGSAWVSTNPETLSSKFEIWESANNVIGHSHNLHSQLSHCIQIWELEIKIQNTQQSEDTYEGETRSESRKLVFGCFCIVSS